MKLKSPKFFAHINSRNKRYNNECKENFNLPQLSHRRVTFQQLIENEDDGNGLNEENILTIDMQERKPQIQEIYIFDPEGRREKDNDMQVFNSEIQNAIMKRRSKHSKSVVEPAYSSKIELDTPLKVK